MRSLILTVTRSCNLRCSYCPTVKVGWPSLDGADALKAIALFDERYGGGDIKLFGGEPLLEPEVVRAVIDEAQRRPGIRRVYLSTNGLGLDEEWLRLVANQPKLVLTISMDGRPKDHRRLRKALPGVEDSYDHLMSIMPLLRRTPRVVITQTIAPATAAAAAENFQHLYGLGFRRFNFLPGYFIPWRESQVEALRRGFESIAASILDVWKRGERLYVRNLFTYAPTPFFNTGVVVDCDGSIHASNLGLSGAVEELLPQTRAGSLNNPPTLADLERHAARVNSLLEAALPEKIWTSTQVVDAELTRFCENLFAHYGDYRRRRILAA